MPTQAFKETASRVVGHHPKIQGREPARGQRRTDGEEQSGSQSAPLVSRQHVQRVQLAGIASGGCACRTSSREANQLTTGFGHVHDNLMILPPENGLPAMALGREAQLTHHAARHERAVCYPGRVDLRTGDAERVS